MRKPWQIKYLLILLIPICVSGLSPQLRTPRPVMVIEERSFDFKEVMEGQVIEHAFKVPNEGGPEPLTTVSAPFEPFYGLLRLQTSYPEQPQITIMIEGRTPAAH